MATFTNNNTKNLKILKVCDGLLFYIPGFLGQSSDRYFKLCSNLRTWRQEKISIYGKEHPLPRLTLWYSKEDLDYRYSGIKMTPKRYPKVIETLSNKVCSFTDMYFNSVLLNKYRDGSDKIGWHRDNEKCLGEIVNIATISLGSSRTFLAKKSSRKETFDLALEHGSLLLMMHPFQNEWTHSLPARPKIKQSRISLTFRKIDQLRKHV